MTATDLFVFKDGGGFTDLTSSFQLAGLVKLYGN